MGCMIKKVILFLLFSVFAFTSQYKLDLSDDHIKLVIPANSNLFVSDSLQENVYSLVLKGNISVNEDIWGYNISKITSQYDGKNTKLDFYFEKKGLKPEIEYKDGKMEIDFIFSSVPTKEKSVYLRMFLGILIILVLILVLYWFLKLMLKRNISSDIPGIGRLLGKVDIMPGKTLAFYELLNTIYLVGITTDNITLLDKIEDEIVCDRIKEGFSRKKDFSSYLKFFGKEIDSTEIDMTQEIIKEKVEKLKRK
ncbi:flagellar biosynthetic protein FliO [Deferribacteraceae bacterium V6Fe1]|nr:flagellar biosynthetic protein FliO [Deferribacteraceae bacterium V6Fe1]